MHYTSSSLMQRRQAGVAMIMAILIVALITALVTAAGREFVLGFKRASNHYNHEQGYYYLLTAEELAKQGLIQEDIDNPDYDQESLLTEQVYPLDDADGWIQGKLIDAQGRINLNALKAKEGEKSKHGPEQEVLSRLLQELGLAPTVASDLVDAITDWVDKDGVVSSLSGGEDDSYRMKEPAYLAANQPMQSLSELLWIEGINRDIYRRLQPFVTVWADKGAINVNSAPLAVLKALTDPPLNDSEAEALIEGRPYDTHNQFKKRSEITGKQLEIHVVDKSERYILSAEVEVFGSRQTMNSVLKRDGKNIEVLARSAGLL